MPASLAVVFLTLSGTAGIGAQPVGGTALATVISPEGLNLRAAPSVTSPALTLIPFASVVALTGAPTADNWYPVSFGERTGWALGDYLTAGAVDPNTATGATPLSAVPASGPVSGVDTGAAVRVAAPRTTAAGAPFRAMATYYGVDDAAVAGRPMACGGAFNPFDEHAASTNDFPCGTRLHVTGPDGRSVDVTVTDHGQYPSHWIDLTYAAFARLADHRAGAIQVTIELLP